MIQGGSDGTSVTMEHEQCVTGNAGAGTANSSVSSPPQSPQAVPGSSFAVAKPSQAVRAKRTFTEEGDLENLSHDSGGSSSDEERSENSHVREHSSSGGVEKGVRTLTKSSSTSGSSKYSVEQMRREAVQESDDDSSSLTSDDETSTKKTASIAAMKVR
jgi:hypothetical protein